MNMNKHVAYHPAMPIIYQMIQTLYEINDCGCGGLAHIVTDDDNIDDRSIRFVDGESCSEQNQDRIEAPLVHCIMTYLLKLTYDQRKVLFFMMRDGDDDGWFLHGDESGFNMYIENFLPEGFFDE